MSIMFFSSWLVDSHSRDNACFHKFLISAHICWIHCSCDKVNHIQEVRFLLYILGQIVTWQYIPNPLELSWPCTVINDHDWQWWNCPLPCYRVTLPCLCPCVGWGWVTWASAARNGSPYCWEARTGAWTGWRGAASWETNPPGYGLKSEQSHVVTLVSTVSMIP